jgi:hypothetical protein
MQQRSYKNDIHFLHLLEYGSASVVDAQGNTLLNLILKPGNPITPPPQWISPYRLPWTESYIVIVVSITQKYFIPDN